MPCKRISDLLGPGPSASLSRQGPQLPILRDTCSSPGAGALGAGPASPVGRQCPGGRECSAASQACCTSAGVPGFYPGASQKGQLSRLCLAVPTRPGVGSLQARAEGVSAQMRSTGETGVPSAPTDTTCTVHLGHCGGCASGPLDAGVSHKPCSWSNCTWSAPELPPGVSTSPCPPRTPPSVRPPTPANAA